MKQKILDTVSDIISDFLYYDRKEDEELTVGDIEESIRRGVITVKEIVEKFEQELRKNVQ